MWTTLLSHPVQTGIETNTLMNAAGLVVQCCGGYSRFYRLCLTRYLIRPLYLHSVDRLANKFLLGHLAGYHYEAGVVVAPEGRDRNMLRTGDMYSNINAGKILLILEVSSSCTTTWSPTLKTVTDRGWAGCDTLSRTTAS